MMFKFCTFVGPQMEFAFSILNYLYRNTSLSDVDDINKNFIE